MTTSRPSPEAARSPARGASRTIILAAGIIFFLGAIVHNPWTVSLAVRAARALMDRPSIATPDADRVYAMQGLFALAALALVLVSWGIGRVGPLDRVFRKSWMEKFVLAFFVIAVPVAWLEFGLRAFVPPREETTKVFVRDDRLGWKLRPGAVDRWGGVQVRINGHGARGPLVRHEKPAGTRRIVYLGDSVTFGYRVGRWQDTYPFVVDSLLSARGGARVETVNLAVDGYAQWQQYIVLAEEGLRYSPDLVVVGFVLNDVTEMFHLPRFGGSDDGFQLRHAYASWIDRALSKSAIVYQVRNIAGEMKARRALGADLRLGAIRQEMLEVETLIHRPEQGNVKLAWEFALADLQEIVDLCAARAIPVLVVVFPHAVQLADPLTMNAPQRVLTAYAEQKRFAAVDLLLPLAAHLRDTGDAPSSLFLDHNHLSVEGHHVVARILADPIGFRVPAREP